MTMPIDDIPEVRGRFLWHSSYYDGPRSGSMLTEDGRRLWFDLHPESEDRWRAPYYYLVYDLTPEEWAAEDAIHELFRKYVGTHCDYDENGRRDIGATRPRSEWRKFYDTENWRAARRTDYLPKPVGLWAPRGMEDVIDDEEED